TIINERIFFNGGTPMKVPLMSVIGASNEFPEEGDGLEALFDRFLLRFEVDYLAEDMNFISMLKNEGQQMKMPALTLEELKHLQSFCDSVVIPEDVYTAIANIRKELRDEGIRPSDRRFKQSLSMLQARALIHSRKVVWIEDIIILENAVWETIEQKEIVSIIIRRHAQDTVIQKLDSLRFEAMEVFNSIRLDQSVEAAMEATQKMKAIEA